MCILLFNKIGIISWILRRRQCLEQMTHCLILFVCPDAEPPNNVFLTWPFGQPGDFDRMIPSGGVPLFASTEESGGVRVYTTIWKGGTPGSCSDAPLSVACERGESLPGSVCVCVCVCISPSYMANIVLGAHDRKGHA